MTSPRFEQNHNSSFGIVGTSVHVTVCAPHVVRVRLGSRTDEDPSSFLPARTWPTPDRSPEFGAASIDTGALGLRLQDEPRRLRFCDRSGQVRIQLELGVTSPRHVRLELVGEQHFYGLGQGGGFARLGTSRRLWNGHVNRGTGADIAVPLLISHLGYGLFFDNASLARLDTGDSDSTTWIDYEWSAGMLDLYFLAGERMADALSGAADLLGHAPMPPRWVLGYLQSSRHFDSVDELRRLPTTFRDKSLPCDAIILLSSYGEAMGWNRGVGYLEWHEDLATDAAALVADWHKQHIRVVTHEYPVVDRHSPLLAEAERRGFLLDHAYPPALDPRPPAAYRDGQRFIDFSHPEAGGWWWELHRELLRVGVDGWWLDGGEGPPAETRLHQGNGLMLRNRYDLMRQQAFAEGEARDRPDQRAFLFCRSGGPGMQRFGAGCWTGDINNTFTTFESQIGIGLNMGMSGVPYWATDIGGFYHLLPGDPELFARWFQFGAFCPIFRAHGRTWREHLPWSYGTEIEAICRRYLELRYRLIPYNYTLAWQTHRQGLPLMRPLSLAYPEDPNTWELGHQYLWGDDLLVAPVTRSGATHWPVYLPRGRWHDFWTHQSYEGPGGVTVAAPLDRLPLFVRAGAILPLAPVAQHLDGPPASDLTLLVYPGASGSFTLYDDDGMTNAYRRGRHALTSFSTTPEADALVCRVAAPEGDAAVIPRDRTYTFQIYAPRAPQHVALSGGAPLPQGRDAGPRCWWHDGQNFLFIRIGSHPAETRIAWVRTR